MNKDKKKKSIDLQPKHKLQHEKAKLIFESKYFNDVCEEIGLKPTKRQARKWNNKKGAAYKYIHKIYMDGFILPNVN